MLKKMLRQWEIIQHIVLYFVNIYYTGITLTFSALLTYDKLVHSG